MSEHSLWHKFFEAFIEYRNHLKSQESEGEENKKELIKSKSSLLEKAARYLKEIMKYNTKTSDVIVDVRKLMVELIAAIKSDNFSEITRCIDEIGKIRHNIPERIGFFASLFGKKPEQVNQGVH